MKESLSHALGKEEFRKLRRQGRQAPRQDFAITGSQHFQTVFTKLRSVNAHPDAVDLRPRAPEGYVLFQVAGPREHGARNDPVDIDLAAFDVLEDALVGCRLAPDVVILGEAVHRDGYTQTRDVHPL